ncbi:MAG: NADH-quinone oxidoreductase subunit J [Candidatus Latescibacteria bacterium]|jgi:NADH-quinone oxidoreductase subunit J|nr:NADH-quinone oxidoreductase subunit J [Candidatus Latescibacterota bacterium]
MDLTSLVFYGFAALTVGSAALVVFANRLTHAVFALLFTFFGVAGLYVFLDADFLAAAQVLIYVGGILILLIFGVMLTNRIYDLRILSERVQFLPSVVAVAITFGLLVAVILKTRWPVLESVEVASTSAEIGRLLMTDYLLPFEVAGFLLLAALLGASMLAGGDEEEEEGES